MLNCSGDYCDSSGCRWGYWCSLRNKVVGRVVDRVVGRVVDRVADKVGAESAVHR